MRPLTLYILLFGLAAGTAVGVGGYAFVYARGYSYLQNDPAACANCHVMQAHFDGWTKGSHRSAAGCNDCHAPPGTIDKYLVKAENGFWHSLKFTTGDFHEPIRIRQKNHDVTEQACRGCHREIVDAIDGTHGAAEPNSCVRCHDSVGHMR
ncbi:cytochrome c nitrite reductase small subunit [Vulgatibacter incomptus]|uniref:Cytochrome c nitrite reductase, small subunit NrfH n=1 Tax=Vulgatibacter incomptus TaxID=1391653 RepID=A0A0K1PG35_9BACT|nr:cytochrome c nitrite reductase small subunit [Vulgatibacter incomptus]AKU92074.1 Cytochrome c nitrite reductase, small subunit NrfH [Vulgatibacter incomptus]